MNTDYASPASYGVSNTEAQKPKGSFWGHFKKEKEKYFDTLTSYLLAAFIAVCIMRAIALKTQVDGLIDCVPAYGNHQKYMYSYIIFIFLFGATFFALKKENRLFLLGSLGACGIGFLYKFITLVSLSLTDDLMDTCYLAQGFGKWTFVIGFLESLLFASVLVRIYKAFERLSKN